MQRYGRPRTRGKRYSAQCVVGVVWTDPDSRNDERAFYYVRVLEIPTPRWTAYDAKFYGLTNLPDEIPLVTNRVVPMFSVGIYSTIGGRESYSSRIPEEKINKNRVSIARNFSDPKANEGEVCAIWDCQIVHPQYLTRRRPFFVLDEVAS